MTQPDPPVLEVLTRVIVWRHSLGDLSQVELSAEERALADAVDVMLASRHTLRDSQDRNEEQK